MKMRGHLSLDTIDNLVIPSDSQFPEALEGELFRLTAQVEQYLPGYYLFRSGSWTPCFADPDVLLLSADGCSKRRFAVVARRELRS